jgi:hypothetical protein
MGLVLLPFVNGRSPDSLPPCCPGKRLPGDSDFSGAGAVSQTRHKAAAIPANRENQWLAVAPAYCFVAIIWSDFPFVAFKRWIKLLWHPIMVLISSEWVLKVFRLEVRLTMKGMGAPLVTPPPRRTMGILKLP